MTSTTASNHGADIEAYRRSQQPHSHHYQPLCPSSPLEKCSCGHLRARHLDDSIHPKEAIERCDPPST